MNGPWKFFEERQRKLAITSGKWINMTNWTQLKNLMNQKVKHFNKPTQVWWLSTHEAVEAIYSAWTLLILSLEHEAASSNKDGAAKARGMISKLKCFVFITTTCILLDVLGVISKCSKVFLTDMINIDQIQSMLEATLILCQWFKT